MELNQVYKMLKTNPTKGVVIHALDEKDINK